MRTFYTTTHSFPIVHGKDCYELLKNYDKILLDIISGLMGEKHTYTDELPLLFKSLKERGLIPEFYYERIVGLLLEIDGIIEARTSGETGEKECMREIEGKYREIIALVNTINTNQNEQININLI
ncbi:MAG: hypothetical protein ACP6IP_05830 [Candidatus Njordarchaeia archaeon]